MLRHALKFGLCILPFAFASVASASEPTLARLSFWPAEGDVAAFEPTFEAKVAPILNRQGFQPYVESERPVPEDIFWPNFRPKSRDFSLLATRRK